ncbi:MAG: DUF503 domain-containing protein [Leptolyngbya sp. PLA2]|nr:DUF503 domain-containing protein [Leptolyngbya sp.]MCE7972518.1 DUF503 domain-containing protein [Leptolyngbya sp. PL-A2]MCZ7632576.1 DUF503 domain-containing protein [Phycisphaerales bacterium]MDL1904968.1 DUF503 domain-containing protein [Synechococcales cyanobacterium CNB]GIK19867.1 MAG: hypothetical protein BroJett004_20310 [Planctomycetota bacterium]
MVIGVLQFELVIPESGSLKDKRRVVRSLRDRLHREHMVSVAEVAAQDSVNIAVMAAAVVATDGRRAGEVLDHVAEKLRSLRDAELGSVRRDILQGEDGSVEGDGEDGQEDRDALAVEMRRYYEDQSGPGMAPPQQGSGQGAEPTLKSETLTRKEARP